MHKAGALIVFFCELGDFPSIPVEMIQTQTLGLP